MARTPRASVSKTSGQGISRLSYQKGRQIAKSGGGPNVKGPGATDMSAPRSYAKGGGKSKDKTGLNFNVSYGNTYHPSDLEELGGMYPAQRRK